MKLPYILVATLAASLLADGIFANEDLSRKNTGKRNRIVRQSNADQMVQNILKWLEGVYTQQSRRSRFADYHNLFNYASDKLDDAFRQGTFREYLPPTNTQKPRPFETAPPPSDNAIDHNGIYGGYPPAGSITPQPPFPVYTGITGGYPTPTVGYPTSIFPDHGTPPRPTGFPTGPTVTTGPTEYPTPAFPTHGPETPAPGGFTGYPAGPPTAGPTTEAPTQPPLSTAAPTETANVPEPEVITGYPSFSTQPPPELTTISGGPSQPPVISTGYPTQQPEVTEASVTTSRPVIPTEAVVETEAPTSGPSSIPETGPFTSPSVTTLAESSPVDGGTTQSPASEPTTPEIQPVEVDQDDESKHPPHIHAIDVECAKDMMTINLEFNREFNGIIYSKGYYNMPECRYVQENSGQVKYTFTVNQNMCGTQFINAFETQGQSYLENILVLQNEAGIQEIWDTVRAVRCLWEGNLKDTLSVSLNVGMLSQELVTFSGDTAMAKLDILLGRGPLGEPVNGLVKIGEPMTLVVSVSGDPGFDLQVKDCRATDSTGDNTIPLTDDNGCVLKPKLFGAFQKTRDTGDSGASIIAYAYFNAFKFPDVMDLMIECNIELCKTNCEMCTEPDQKLEPGRRRKRDLYSYNKTGFDGVTMGKHLRIILPEDLNEGSIVDLRRTEGVCMSTQSFVFSTALLISLLTASCLFSAYMWLKTQQLRLIKK